MADDTIRLNFAPPKFTVRRFPVPRKLGPVFFEMPVGSQLLAVSAPDHDPTAILFHWAIPVNERPTERLKFLVVEEGQPFTVTECTDFVDLGDGTVYEETHAHLAGVGFYTEVSDDDGSYKTMHILEIVPDEDPTEDAAEEPSPEPPPEEST